jgi:hypothetical protein
VDQGGYCQDENTGFEGDGWKRAYVEAHVIIGCSSNQGKIFVYFLSFFDLILPEQFYVVGLVQNHA